MSNIGNISDISIEQFASFLDGNLSEVDMQTVSDAIDGNPIYSDIIGDVMNVDDYAESLDANGMVEIDDVLVEDFVLPEIPTVNGEMDTVDVIPFDGNNANDVVVIGHEAPEVHIIEQAGDTEPELHVASATDNPVETANATPTLPTSEDSEITLQDPTDSTTDIELNDLA